MRAAKDERVRLAQPSTDETLAGVLDIARELHLDVDVHDLASRFLATLAALFPGRALGLRLVESPGTVQTFLGPGAPPHLPQATLCPLRAKRSAAAKTRLDPEAAAGSVEVVDLPPPVFEGLSEGFSAVLVAQGAFFGCLDVGYPPGAVGPRGEPADAVAAVDELAILPLANQLSVALRNLRLHGESEVLKDTLAKLIDHADALIIQVDRQLTVRIVNQALVRLSGIAYGELLGRDVAELLPPRDRVRLLAALNEALAGGQSRAIAVSLPSARGGRVHTIWNVAGVSNGREIDAVVGVGQDVTRLRSLEEQIVHAEKLASLGQIAAGVAHELNNPLTSVVVYADYLVKKADRGVAFEPADLERLRRVLGGAERIQAFARELVQYARPSRSKPELLSLNDVVRQSLSFCEHLLSGPGHAVALELGDELPPLQGVRADLQQVVINLVTNAVQALDGRPGHLRLRTFAKSARHLALIVEDDAGGISDALRDRIFEPFFTTKVDGRGAGLGLSIVRNIVEQHEGNILCESKPGVRTTFTVVLPRSRAPG